MIIRPAQDKDRSDLTSLHLAEDVEVYKKSSEVYRGGILSAISSRTKDIVLVAEDDDGYVAGYLWGVALRIFDYKIGIIFDLYVNTRMRQKGCGRKLMQEGIEEFHKLGVHRIWANPEEKNAPTLALLEHLGFKKQDDKVFYQLLESDAQHEWGQE